MTRNFGSSVVLSCTKHDSLVKYNLIISGFLILFIYFSLQSMAYSSSVHPTFMHQNLHRDSSECGFGGPRHKGSDSVGVESGQVLEF